MPIRGQIILEDRGIVPESARSGHHIILMAGLMAVPPETAAKFCSIKRSLRPITGQDFGLDDHLNLWVPENRSNDVKVSPYVQNGEIGWAFSERIWRF